MIGVDGPGLIIQEMLHVILEKIGSVVKILGLLSGLETYIPPKYGFGGRAMKLYIFHFLDRWRWMDSIG